MCLPSSQFRAFTLPTHDNRRLPPECAHRYDDGRGVDRDAGKAARLYRTAADMGFAPAQYNLGRLYERGRGVKRDVLESRKRYRMASAPGLRWVSLRRLGAFLVSLTLPSSASYFFLLYKAFLFKHQRGLSTRSLII